MVKRCSVSGFLLGSLASLLYSLTDMPTMSQGRPSCLVNHILPQVVLLLVTALWELWHRRQRSTELAMLHSWLDHLILTESNGLLWFFLSTHHHQSDLSHRRTCFAWPQFRCALQEPVLQFCSAIGDAVLGVTTWENDFRRVRKG